MWPRSQGVSSRLGHVGQRLGLALEGRVYITVLFCSLAVLDPTVGHTMDVLSPFISVLCHSD